MNVVTYLISELNTQGVKKIFLTLGSHIDPLVSALLTSKKVTPVICAHEAGAGFMAEGYGIANDCIGVAACIGGPGLANLIPALLSAKHDQRPLLIITGDVPTTQHALPAFHNAGPNHMADIATTSLFCKSALRLNHANDLPNALTNSLRLASIFPCGPVHLQIPRDIFSQTLSVNTQVTQPQKEEPTPTVSNSFDDITRLLESAHYPLIYLGRRAIQGMPAKSLRTWLTHVQMPIVTTIYAKGILPEDNPLVIGTAGFAGSEKGNTALLHKLCDTLVVIGADISERNSLEWHTRFFNNKRKILVLDNHLKPETFPSNPNVKWLPYPTTFPSLSALSAKTADIRKRWLSVLQTPFHNQHYLAKIQEHVGSTTLFVDAGTSKKLAANHWQAKHINDVVMSESTGSMGWGMCAAIGASLQHNAKPVIALVGDGSARMLGVELSTAAQYKAPVLFLINNNKQQKSVYDRMNHVSQRALDKVHPDINWVTFANSLNIEATKVSSEDHLLSVIKKFWPINKPYLLEITIPESE